MYIETVYVSNSALIGVVSLSVVRAVGIIWNEELIHKTVFVGCHDKSCRPVWSSDLSKFKAGVPQGSHLYFYKPMI